MSPRYDASDDIVVLYCALPDYRQRFVEALGNKVPTVRFLVGRRQFEPTVVSAVDSIFVEEVARNIYLFGRRFLWQAGVNRPAIRASVCVVELNPRSLNSWTLLLLRRALRRPTLVWGHAWPRAGRESRSDIVRGWQRSLADAVIVYTEAEARALEEKSHGRLNVHVAPNALYSKREMTSRPRQGQDIVYVGRLVKEKRPSLLLEAFAQVSAILKDSNLVLVGSGPEEEPLRARVSSLGLDDRVTFLGHVSDHSKLSSVYAKAFVAVSPGYVGLSATQAMGFGVPLLYPRGEAHAPEIAIANEHNSRSFDAEDADDLGRGLIDMFLERDYWDEKRGSISEVVGRSFSVEAMSQGFTTAIDSAR